MNGAELTQAIATLAGTPGALASMPDAELQAFFRDALTEANVRYGLIQKIDDAIKLQPGLEELSDIMINQIYTTALPLALASAVKAVR